MNLENIQYDAFISYRHNDIDKFVAETLHKELESFVLPAKLRKRKGKKKIRRVFRDQEELPLTSDLAEPLMNAIKNSEYLIAICSPNYPQSIWCRREVETFIQMHGREKVFAVLVEGRSHDSFMDCMLWDYKKIISEDGKESIVSTPVEPLAADVRAKNKREMKKKLKEEMLRLVAPMFDVSFDDLRQRHHERRVKKIKLISGISSFIFLTFAIVSAGFTFKIQQQQIKIEEQNQKILTEQSKLLAEQAIELTQQGRLDEAKKIALSILPSKRNEDTPYTVEAEYALSEALKAYRNGSVFEPVRRIETNMPVEYLDESKDNEQFAVADKTGNISIFESKTGNQLAQVQADSGTDFDETTLKILDGNKLAYIDEKRVVIYDYQSQKEIDSYEMDGNIYHFYIDDNSQYIALSSSDAMKIYQMKDKKIIYETLSDGESAIADCIYFVQDQNNNTNKIYYAQEPGYQGELENISLFGLDVDSGMICSQNQIKGRILEDIKADENKLFIVSKAVNEDVFDYAPSYITAIDLKSSIILWNQESSYGRYKTVTLDQKKNAKNLAISTSDTVIFMNASTGQPFDSFQNGGDILEVSSIESDNSAFSILTGNKEMVLYLADYMSYRSVDWIAFSGGDISHFSILNGIGIQTERKSNKILIYERNQNEQLKEITSLADNIYTVFLHDDADKMLIDTIEKWYLINPLSGKIIFEKVGDEGIATYGFIEIDNKEQIVKITNEITIIDSKTGKEIKALSLEDEKGEKVQYLFGNCLLSDNGKLLVCDDYNTLFFYNVENGKLIHYINQEDEKYDCDTSYYAINSDATICAYLSAKGNGVHIYQVKDKTIECTLPIKTGMIENMFFIDDNQFAVNLLDQTVEIYDIESGEKIRNIQLGDDVFNIQCFKQKGEMIAHCKFHDYILDDNFQIKAQISGYCGYDQENDIIYTVDKNRIESMKRYSIDELIEYAKKK